MRLVSGGRLALGGLLVASALGLAGTALGPAGCSPDFHDGVGPRVAIPDVLGRAVRDGMAASGLSVSVRNPDNDASMTSTKSDVSGNYALAAPPGAWDLRIKGRLVGDFEALTRGIVVDSQSDRVTLGPLDVSADGAALRTPSDASALALPSATTPLGFAWTNPGRPFLNARVQMYDSTGAAVWYSAKSRDSTATWDGTGNQGVLAGAPVPRGPYTWRVKFVLADSTEARTRTRLVTF